MIIKTCDVCGINTENLNELKEEFRFKNTYHICDLCEKEINTLLYSCEAAQRIQRTSFIKRFIQSIKKI